MKTSASHPLVIPSVPALNGRIGLTFCPGKKQSWGRNGPWDRDLDADLDVIESFGARVVVSALEESELKAVGVPDLGAAVEARGLDWFHLPIVDQGVPDDLAEARLWLAFLEVRRQLEAGCNVVIHCMGGLGRTGTLAARLLIELGSPVEAAITTVRAARTGAIENSRQESYVRQCKQNLTDRKLGGRIAGCLLGGAVGDGFGYALEFDSWAAIKQRHGELGLVSPVYDRGRLVVSDDTQMTLFTLEAVNESGFDHHPALIAAIHRAYLRWLETQGRPGKAGGFGIASRPELRVPRAPGNTCLSALRSGVAGTVAKPINDSKGCGGVMRVAPLGLSPEISAELAFDLAVAAAALTHGHPSGYLSAGALAWILRRALDGVPLSVSAAEASARCRCERGGDQTADALDHAVALAGEPSRSQGDAIRALGQGWVGEEALAIALYAALVGDSMSDVIRIAANHDGDSDSTASIAAQLWGVVSGLEGLPMAWVRRLDVLDVALELCLACAGR